MRIPILIKMFTIISLIILTIFIIVFYNLLDYIGWDLKNIVFILLFLSLLTIIINLLFVKNSKKYYFFWFSWYLIFNLLIFYLITYISYTSQLGYTSELNYKLKDYLWNIFPGWWLDGLNYGIWVWDYIWDYIWYLVYIVFWNFWYTIWGLVLSLLLFLIIVFIYYIIYFLKLRKLSEIDLIVKNDSKWIYISYIIFIISLLTFYFTYYNVPVEIDKVDDKFFVSRYQNIENKNTVLNDTIEKLNILRNKSNLSDIEINRLQELYFCIWTLWRLNDEKNIYTQNCLPEIYDENKIKKDKENIFLKIEELKWTDDVKSKETLDKLKIKLKELGYISSKEFKNKYIYNTWAIDYINLNDKLILKLINNDILFFDEEWDEKRGLYNLFSIVRLNFHNSLYYLDNNNQQKAVDLILSNYKLWNKMMDWEVWIPTLLTWLKISEIWLTQINYVIENYDLSDNIKLEINDVLSKEINDDENFKNAIIIEYKNARDNLTNINIKDNIFYHKNDIDNFLKITSYEASKINNNLDFNNGYSAYNIRFNNPLKRNYIWYQMSTFMWVYSSQWKKLIKLKELKKKILEKLLLSIEIKLVKG